jgi:hypothetical protein
MKRMYLSIFLVLFAVNALAGQPAIPPPGLATSSETVTGTSTTTAVTPAGAAALLAAPPAIGSTTPAAGTFTTLVGNVGVVTQSATGNVAVADMKGQTHRVTGAYTLSLPTAAAGYKAKFMATTAEAFSIDVVTGTDVIRLNGTALTAGNKVTSDGTIYNTIECEANTTGSYNCNSIVGLATDGGA